ncbi:hypothetical protein NDU88_001732 [Pleurodeles waltl]|uniref:Uncharacterized protein n=1 Tax=Pleurodeles waltl TaxID=8319 RepID=A0AAV7T0F2_PLEWA|nr:hypothetical protein NDU88_001732 [Pleurodeles waltl]
MSCPRFIVLHDPFSPQLHLLQWVPCQGRGPCSGPLAARSRSFTRLLAVPDFLVRVLAESAALVPLGSLGAPPGFRTTFRTSGLLLFSPNRGPPVPSTSPLAGGGIETEAHEFFRASAGPLLGCRSGPARPAGASFRLPPPLTWFVIPRPAQAPIVLPAPDPFSPYQGRAASQLSACARILLSRLCRAAILYCRSVSAAELLIHPGTARSLLASVS